ncbi:acyl-CoA ligase FadD12 [Mycolicibacterium sp. CAU 1645]|uniref:Acyl-CoA ligase FadD12 n=1 Tax=Mycolicibacterium arenosum TaxID=2952157 RepID=A0ABT1M4S9_9MYCO|nr:acyl-CoA ligase FadD12 [Mycolicibacterium sp. CAU 1645]MCP9273239.1 acyl-CoA ligase FadD12 [Mycolicibacterium sp. CAU 1645]
MGTFVRAGVLAPLRPDRYLRMAAAARGGGSVTMGFAIAAQRCPDRPGLIDELGTLTWKQLDQRAAALAAGLQTLPGTLRTVGIMCRNHRGFVAALIAADRLGVDVLLLNTSFAGPALAEVVTREDVDAVVYDDEFADIVGRALTDRPDTARVLAWTESTASAGDLTVDSLIAAHHGSKPTSTGRKSKVVLLTSGTTGTPKGARSTSGGGAAELKGILDRIPWRAEEVTVIAAPMFHAWGYSQLIFAAFMATTIATRRRFDPEATLELVDRTGATGLVVVPVMLDRIMDLPPAVRRRYPCRSLRFVTASGSRMRPDVVTAFMDEFGDVVYNNYNATEAGMIATATPADLRAAPDTAGRPAAGTEVRILDGDHREVPAGDTGQIFVRSGTLFDGYTGGSPGTAKHFHDGFMASGDMGYVDSAGRLFVVGRDDEMIVSGGENVYPIEVEKTLTTHPEVAEASVVGVSDEQYGQRLVAFVVLTPGASSSTDDLRAFVRDNLANYKVPREIRVLDELPRNATGKILRAELRASAED